MKMQNLLNGFDNENSNLQQENGTSLIVNRKVIIYPMVE